MAIKSWRVDEWMVCHIFITSRNCEKFCVEFNFKEEYLNLVAVAGQWTSTGKYFSLKRNKQTNYALGYVVVLVHDTNIKEIIFVRWKRKDHNIFEFPSKGRLHDDVIWLKCRNNSGVACLMLIRAIIFTPLGIQNWNEKSLEIKLDFGGCMMTPSWNLPIKKNGISLDLWVVGHVL